MRIAILTSGGDAPGMNAAVRAFTVVGLRRGHEVLGVRDGYAGLLARNLETLTRESTERLTRQGGTLLGSSRCLEMMREEGQARALASLAELGIEGLCVVGGNGSLTGAHVLAPRTACKIVGLPASIDNDVGHAGLAIGVDTAVNTIVEACDRISDTARAHRRAFVVEVMGRNCGFLAMRAGLAAEADAILYGESHATEEATFAHLREVLRRCFVERSDKKRALIVKSEGCPISAHAIRDHLQAYLDEDAPGVDVRETVLGHIVRGGSPTALDRTIALRLGFSAVMALEAGITDTMLAWEPPFQVGAETMDPSVRRVPIGEALEETSKLLDGTSTLIRRRIELLRFVDDCLPG
ncbi:MAG: 6-phosphofructokinase [Myxococcales bacterium]|nr:6-phosphofructokinase [Myxococcales bacterium]